MVRKERVSETEVRIERVSGQLLQLEDRKRVDHGATRLTRLTGLQPRMSWSSGRGIDFEEGTSFYFSNFPEDWGTEALWKMFTRWVRVIDVYLPRKRNKAGQLFGFVRFEGDKSVEDFEAKLNMI